METIQENYEKKTNLTMSGAHLMLTRSNIITDLSTGLDLLHQHSVYQYPPIYVKNKQTEQERIENIISYWAINWVLVLVQSENNFIAAINRGNQNNEQVFIVGKKYMISNFYPPHNPH